MDGIQAQHQEPHNQQLGTGDNPLVLPLAALNASMIPLVGGKAANLGEMTRAGLPVPSGFCITTTAYGFATEGTDLEAIIDELVNARTDDTLHLERGVASARACILATSIPTSVAEAITQAYKALGNGEPVPVAVRSSATAEDLPFASFAGQQETYLNVIGIDAVLDAVRRCWALVEAAIITRSAAANNKATSARQYDMNIAVLRITWYCLW